MMFQATASKQPRLEFLNCLSATSSDRMADDIRRGLAADQKFIPSKYFYDARGSRLFQKICRLPEYYPTRMEMALLQNTARDLTDGFESGDIVELGSGASWKIRILLDAMGRARRGGTRYVPVDVSVDSLTDTGEELLQAYPELQVLCVLADFTQDVHRLSLDRSKLILFFGSTMGNLDDQETRAFLNGIAKTLYPNGRFLLGLDMVKPINILEAAYNDSRQLTADFNKNVLIVLNREMGADFHPDYFEHVAFFNEQLSRIEMHLRAKFRMVVHFTDLNLSVRIAKGETIRTEISRKFTRREVEALAEDAGMKVTRWNSDPNDWFSIAELVLEGS
jgi:L-histidine Nalpha-methyltransferase